MKIFFLDNIYLHFICCQDFFIEIIYNLNNIIIIGEFKSTTWAPLSLSPPIPS